jgi:hypothetical protein
MIVIMLTLVVNMNDALYKRTTKANARGLAAMVDSIMYADISAADSVAVSSDLDFTVRTASSNVRYYYNYDGSTQRYRLYRSVSGSPLLLGKKFTEVRFKYYALSSYNTLDSEITGPPYTGIRRVRVSLNSVVENLGSPDSTISSDFSVCPAHVL